MMMILDLRKDSERYGLGGDAKGSRAEDTFGRTLVITGSEAWKTGDVLICTPSVSVNAISSRLFLPAIKCFSPK